MKNKIIIAIVIILIFAAGYFVARFLPFNFSFLQKDIRGDAELRVIVFRDNNQPVPNLEVDVAKEPGPPPRGGAVETDQEGTANFFVKPGIYYVYFNMGNFPDDLQPLTQGSMEIKVEEGIINVETINLNSK
jgi:hypothetical protein